MTQKNRKDLRPTTGKVREAVFDILRSSMGGASFLDLYAGTGAVGMEAFSQGASSVVFVDENRTRAKKIIGMINMKRVLGSCIVYCRKAAAFIEMASEKGMTFDIIFLDPPYHGEDALNTLEAISIANILSTGGTVVVEHFAKRDLPESTGELKRQREYNYGDTVLSIYTHTVSDIR